MRFILAATRRNAERDARLYTRRVLNTHDLSLFICLIKHTYLLLLMYSGFCTCTNIMQVFLWLARSIAINYITLKNKIVSFFKNEERT